MKPALVVVLVLVVLAWLAWTAASPRAVPASVTAGSPSGEGSGRAPGTNPLPPVAAGSSDLPTLSLPLAGIDLAKLHSNFDDVRDGTRRHEALDLAAPRGTEILAVADGFVRKIFTSRGGGLTVYQFDPTQSWCFYYAHLDRYAAGLTEGQSVRAGELLGYVGTTGNAPRNAPHLHLAVMRLDPDRKWWGGTPVDPYPLLAASAARRP